MKELASNCKITRTGIVKKSDQNTVWIQVEGKVIEVPKAKLAKEVSVNEGDELTWSGICWIAKVNT